MGTTLKAFATMALFGMTAACATPPEQIVPTYVSPNAFADMSCPALRAEAARINGQVAALTGAQQAAVNNDNAMMGIGMLIFWPALLGLSGDINAPQLASMKGMADAINAASIGRGC